MGSPVDLPLGSLVTSDWSAFEPESRICFAVTVDESWMNGSHLCFILQCRHSISGLAVLHSVYYYYYCQPFTV